MNGQQFDQQKRIELKTEQCERSLRHVIGSIGLKSLKSWVQNFMTYFFELNGF